MPHYVDFCFGDIKYVYLTFSFINGVTLFSKGYTTLNYL